jgi:hypothetical protein
MNEDRPRGLTRAALYDAAWATPLSRLAPRCGITDVGLAKLCRRLNIPIPGRGYWRKLETGKRAPRRPPLPTQSRATTDDIVVWMGSEPKTTEIPSAVVAAALEPAALHPTAALALARLRAAKPNRKDDVVAPGYLGIHVLPDTIERVILIIDALAREFEGRGCEFGSDADGRAVVISDRESLRCEIREDPINGRLAIIQDGYYRGRKRWSDGVKARVEKQLGAFIASVEINLANERKERIEREEKEAFNAKLAERRDERKRKAELERATAKSVWRAFIRWEKAQRLRTFATALEAAASSGFDPSPAQFAQMAAEAHALADRLDPLIPDKPPELATMDYMKFEEWHARAVALLGKPEGYKKYGAQKLFELRMTPEEATQEINWEAFWI